jgi:hypothetical protein
MRGDTGARTPAKLETVREYLTMFAGIFVGYMIISGVELAILHLASLIWNAL